MSRQVKKNISLIIAILSFIFFTEEIVKKFRNIKLLYALKYEISSFDKDELILTSAENPSTDFATDIYIYKGILKKHKVNVNFTAYDPSLDRNEEGNILMWYYKKGDLTYKFSRKKDELVPFSPFQFNRTSSLWLSFISTILFIPALIYYINIKIRDKTVNK